MTGGKALVLGHDSRSFLSVIRSLGRAGVEVHAAWFERDSVALRSRYLRRAWPLPPFDERDRSWLPPLEALLQAQRFDAVIPCNDSSIAALQQERERLGRHARLYVLDDRAYDILFDKIKTSALAASLNIAVPREVVVESSAAAEGLPEQFGYPLVLKPRGSYNPELPGIKRYVSKAYSRAEFDHALRGLLRSGPVAIQQNFIGRGVGVELLMQSGRPLLTFQHERVHEPLRGGGSSYRRSVPLHPGMLDAAVRLLAALDYSGVAMVEFKYNPQTGAWVLIEVNARFWGSLPLALAAGCDFPLGLYQMLVEGRVRVPNRYRVGIYCRNWVADLGWQRANLSADKRDPTLATRPLPAVLRDALVNTLLLRERSDTLTLDDPGPGLAELHGLARRAATALRAAAARRWLATPAGRRRAATRALRAAQRARRILFVCKGNICRSPFAERLLQKLRPDVEVSSAGYFPKAGRPSPPEAVTAAREFGLELAAHGARVVDERMLRRCDAIFVFDYLNYRTLVDQYPWVARRVHLLGPLVENGPLFIEDPWATNLDRFRACYREIAAAVQRLAAVAAPRPG